MSITKFSTVLFAVSFIISACGAQNTAEENVKKDTATPRPKVIETKTAALAKPETKPVKTFDFDMTKLPEFLNGADLKVGQREFAKCKACHTIEEGQKNKMGPNLYAIFGTKAGANPDFRYSKPMRESDTVWDMQNIDQFLENPREFMPGTSMAFVGIRNQEKRRALMAYLFAATSENAE